MDDASFLNPREQKDGLLNKQAKLPKCTNLQGKKIDRKGSGEGGCGTFPTGQMRTKKAERVSHTD